MYLVMLFLQSLQNCNLVENVLLYKKNKQDILRLLALMYPDSYFMNQIIQDIMYDNFRILIFIHRGIKYECKIFVFFHNKSYFCIQVIYFQHTNKSGAFDITSGVSCAFLTSHIFQIIDDPNFNTSTAYNCFIVL